MAAHETGETIRDALLAESFAAVKEAAAVHPGITRNIGLDAWEVSVGEAAAQLKGIDVQLWLTGAGHKLQESQPYASIIKITENRGAQSIRIGTECAPELYDNEFALSFLDSLRAYRRQRDGYFVRMRADRYIPIARVTDRALYLGPKPPVLGSGLVDAW